MGMMVSSDVESKVTAIAKTLGVVDAATPLGEHPSRIQVIRRLMLPQMTILRMMRKV
jgi:hypothetical protein